MTQDLQDMQENFENTSMQEWIDNDKNVRGSSMNDINLDQNVYETLAKLDVSEFTEKKGDFTYLSWADAVNVMLIKFPEAHWDVIKSPDGWPYVQTPSGCFVEVALTIKGVKRTQIHPVLDHRNKAVKEPDSFQVNTSIQRCLAKAISLHGLGLYIYRGEDLPANPEKVTPDPIREAVVQSAYDAFKEEIDKDEEEVNIDRIQKGYSRLTNDERMAVDSLFGKDKPEDSTKMYRSLLKLYVTMKLDSDKQ